MQFNRVRKFNKVMIKLGVDHPYMVMFIAQDTAAFELHYV